MSLAKRIGKSERVRGLLCWLAAQYIRLAGASGRWRTLNGEIPAAYWDSGKPFILAFWHGRLLMMSHSWRRGVPISMLISHHRDGQLIARTVAHFGIKSVAGSSSRGGGAALRGMLKLLKGGECVGITPDGPRGPRQRASGGVAMVAKLSGCPVIPLSFSARHRKLLSSWDRFALPRPFSEGVFIWGQPIVVPRDADEAALEAARLQVEEVLNHLGAEADRLMGHEPVPPAEPLPEPDPEPAGEGA